MDNESKRPARAGVPHSDAAGKPLQSCLDAFQRSADNIKEIRQALWGGPLGAGLVHVVGEMAKTTAAHQAILIGNGKEGLHERVRRHDRFVEKYEERAKWTNRLLLAQLVAIGWFVLKAALGI